MLTFLSLVHIYQPVVPVSTYLTWGVLAMNRTDSLLRLLIFYVIRQTISACWTK